ncbi:methyltransferase domain-containing protein [Deinococcus sp. Arct2-2]|uniref:class I SAM-dependent methyltransferase n=1 Tax=Deinococcus sp. Arct2-2 TaxID=2568653 RepID=UPI0010A56C56|nr:class I SAM-dependent methyltransferase [Deinococcus sp. Arct2-2]THF67835.1 methyltransferase domain-containing protein [Deinococcus sp. Arct2-2]
MPSPILTLPEARYDEFTQWYVDLVDEMLADPSGPWQAMLGVFEQRRQNRVANLVVLDVACGEGHLSRFVSQYQPKQVIGIDISRNLLAQARRRTQLPSLEYRLDDAQTLGTLADASVDVVVSSLALMDIPHHGQLFAAMRRVLKPGGVLVFSCLHPCFEAPFHELTGPQFLNDGEERVGYIIRNYHQVGAWQSGNAGLRGHFGAHHRTLASIVNPLTGTGFQVTHLAEPVASGPGLFGGVPRLMVIEAQG